MGTSHVWGLAIIQQDGNMHCIFFWLLLLCVCFFGGGGDQCGTTGMAERSRDPKSGRTLSFRTTLTLRPYHEHGSVQTHFGRLNAFLFERGRTCTKPCFWAEGDLPKVSSQGNPGLPLQQRTNLRRACGARSGAARIGGLAHHPRTSRRGHWRGPRILSLRTILLGDPCGR